MQGCGWTERCSGGDVCCCRRAEAEADLIGLKLMALAGYNADLAPKTFAKMEEYQAKMMGKAAANASYIQDHPRSANRVKLLEVCSSAG